LRRNYSLKHVIEGKIEGRIEVTGRRVRRRKQLLDGLKEKRGNRKLQEEATDCTVCRTRFGRGYGPVVRQTADEGIKKVYSFGINVCNSRPQNYKNFSDKPKQFKSALMNYLHAHSFYCLEE
jgi:hypothetical protein